MKSKILTNKLKCKMKKLFTTLSFAIICTFIYAQKGISGINEATSQITSFFDPLEKLSYAIAAIVGLIGGIQVYSKWSKGDPHTKDAAAAWGGACIFFVVIGAVLRAFFL